jgi:hypothetical protein
MYMLRFALFTSRLLVVPLLVVSFSVLSARIADAPRLQRLVAALRPGNCAQTCWHGIEIGRTTIAEARHILSADPTIVLLGNGDYGCQLKWRMVIEGITWYAHVCSPGYGDNGDVVSRIELSATNNQSKGNFMVADSLSLFGEPISVGCDTVLQGPGPATLFTFVSFESGVVATASQYLPYEGFLYNPTIPVVWIQYGSHSNLGAYPQLEWQRAASEKFQPTAIPPQCLMR